MDEESLKFSLGIKHQMFNNEVRRRRTELGMTQAQLAEAVGLSAPTLGQIETFRKFPTDEQARKIADALHSHKETLFPKWIEELKDKPTSVTTEHLVTERMIAHPELKLLSDHSDEQQAEQVDQGLLAEKLNEAIQTLSPREKRVLQLRFGLEDNIDRTYEQVGDVFGVSRERIRQIEAKAFRKLKHPTKRAGLEPFITDTYVSLDNDRVDEIRRVIPWLKEENRYPETVAYLERLLDRIKENRIIGPHANKKIKDIIHRCWAEGFRRYR